MRKYLTQNESLVRLTLMQADLEFEYPHKLEKMIAKADVLELADKEEEKLKFGEFAKEAEKARRKLLTYEEYFQLDPKKDGHIMADKRDQSLESQSKGDMTFEEFLELKQSENLFHNDLLELEYKFWESQEDKEQRLKKIWIDLKRKNAFAENKDTAQANREQIELNKQIAELVRRIRWRVDQELTSRHIEPIFKENYYSYTKDEFMFDADFEFYKVRNLLSKSPRLLREDPILGVDYLKIIGLIRQKKLLERSTDKFDPTASPEVHYYDLEKAEARRKELEQLEQDRRARALEADLSGQDAGVLEAETAMETQIKNEKKASAKAQLQVLKQVDSVAESLARQDPAKAAGFKLKKETAGDIKRREREKSKKEKTLGAKLRLKEKKSR